MTASVEGQITIKGTAYVPRALYDMATRKPPRGTSGVSDVTETPRVGEMLRSAADLFDREMAAGRIKVIVRRRKVIYIWYRG